MFVDTFPLGNRSHQLFQNDFTLKVCLKFGHPALGSELKKQAIRTEF